VANLDADDRLEILIANGEALGSYLLDDVPFGDYNRDGLVNQADRDLYDATVGQAAVPAGSGADGDRSGVIDAADLAIWEANQGRGQTPRFAPADLDQNQRIDGHDFLAWQRAVGAITQFPNSPAEDIDYSGTVDGGDLAVWTRHFNQSARSTSIASSSPAAATQLTAESGLGLEANVVLEAAVAPAPTSTARRALSRPPSYFAAQDAAITSFTLTQPVACPYGSSASRPLSGDAKKLTLTNKLIERLHELSDD
jgi:hypothetical protein